MTVIILLIVRDGGMHATYSLDVRAMEVGRRDSTVIMLVITVLTAACVPWLARIRPLPLTAPAHVPFVLQSCFAMLGQLCSVLLVLHCQWCAPLHMSLTNVHPALDSTSTLLCTL